MSANAVTTITTVQPQQAHRIERDRDAGDERSRSIMSDDAGEHRLDRPRDVEAGDQLELGDRRHQIALVQAARLVVDEDDAAADHHHHEDRHHDRAGQQVLDVRHVGIDLDDVERAPAPDTRGVVGGWLNAATRLPTGPTSVADTKLSVLSSISATRGSFFWSTRRENSGGIVSTPLMRPLRRSVERVRPGRRTRPVSNVSGAGGHGAGQLADLHGRHAVVLVDDRRPSGA